MTLRLSLISVVSGGVYLWMATRRPELYSYEGVAAWAGLFLLYALAVHAVAVKKDRSTGIVLLVLLGSVTFRALTFPFSGEIGQALLLRAAAYGGDLLALVLGVGLLRRVGLSPALALVHGFNPFVILTLPTAEPLTLLAFAGGMVTLRLAVAQQPWPSALLLGVSLGGALPVWALVPLMARVLRARLLVSLGIGAGLFWLRGLPEIPEGYPGASLFPSLVTVTRLLITRDATVPMGLAAVAFAGVVLVQALSLDEDLIDLPARALASVGAFVFLSPFVDESWFVLVGYLAAFSSSRGWLLLTATAPLTRFGIAGEGGFRFWIGFAQYFPAFASLIFAWLGRKKT